jgi:hypothetical protein
MTYLARINCRLKPRPLFDSRITTDGQYHLCVEASREIELEEGGREL